MEKPLLGWNVSRIISWSFVRLAFWHGGIGHSPAWSFSWTPFGGRGHQLDWVEIVRSSLCNRTTIPGRVQKGVYRWIEREEREARKMQEECTFCSRMQQSCQQHIVMWRHVVRLDAGSHRSDWLLSFCGGCLLCTHAWFTHISSQQ